MQIDASTFRQKAGTASGKLMYHLKEPEEESDRCISTQKNMYWVDTSCVSMNWGLTGYVRSNVLLDDVHQPSSGEQIGRAHV